MTQEQESLPKRIPIRIERVLELEGAYDPKLRADMWVHAHVSTPTNTPEGPKQYVLLSNAPQHGIAYLGKLNPATREFILIDPTGRNLALYKRANNHVVQEMYVPVAQLEELQTLDEVLAIQGLRIRQELIPQ